MPPAPPPPARTRHIHRASRRIGWSEWGTTNGAPLLFCSGAGMSSSFAFGGDSITALGLRLLVIDRAGLGLSEPDPDKSFASFSDDVAAVLQAERITRPPVIGFSQGAPFALALAAAGIVSTVVLASGQDELAHPRMRPLLLPDVAGLIDAIAADRPAFEASFAQRVDADGLWSLILAMSAPADRALYEEPGFASGYRQCLQEGFAQGPAGYVRDLTLALSRWPAQPETITVPVSLWYGARDTSPVHSPNSGRTLAARFPDARLHTLPDEGGSLLWTRSGEILREAVALRRPL